MTYIRLFKDINKKEQLYILDNNIDKIIIINEITDIELKESALEKVNDYENTFKELFHEGDYSLISQFSDKILNFIFDSKQMKVLHEYNKYTRDSIKQHFSQYIHNYYDTLDEKDISTIATLIFNIDTSNSEEISKQADSFLDSILSTTNPLESFQKVEKIFLQNHLPYFAKIYLTFFTVHSDFESYSFENSRNGSHHVSSAVLNRVSLLHKKVLVLTDLIKCSLESNNIKIQEYLNKLEYGNKLYEQYKNQLYDKLNDVDKKVLAEFRDILFALHNNMLRKNTIIMSGDVIQDITNMESVLPLNNKTLADYIVSRYLHIIGINSISEARQYMLEQNRKANQRNIKLFMDNNYEIKQGDFIKGFNIQYFSDMIQNGIVAKDYLGADMDTDATALDTDLSRIWKDTTGMSINDIIDLKNKDSGMFGQGYIILKDDSNIISITKKSINEPNSRIDIVDKKNIFENKLEAFCNGTGSNISNPYGIRTGFPSSKISFIVLDEAGKSYNENIYKLILPMVMNGLYIPIISKNKVDDNGLPILLFSENDYNKLREKMSGLSYYGINGYKISENIDSDIYREIASQIDDSNKVIGNIKRKIISDMQEAIKEDYSIITYINGSLIKKELQVLDTGSTSRSTNIPYDGDYDFVVRINRDIDINPDMKIQFVNKLISKFDIVKSGNQINGDIKEMVIKIDNEEYKLDLSFTRKTDKVSYSTEMCVEDRLNTIKRKYPDKYKLVLSNIIFAKKYLKENECYKKGSYGQGGLGGVGVENWILQNGGSFYDAAVDFISNAYTKDGEQIDFEIFKEKYFVWDFGENFYTDRENSKSLKKNNLHDNFISNNLTKEGYQKMCKAFKVFIENYQLNHSNISTNFIDYKNR